MASPMTLEEQQALFKSLHEKLALVFTCDTSDGAVQAADDLALTIKQNGSVSTLVGSGILQAVEKAAKDKKSGYAREGAMIAYGSLFPILGPAVLPIALPHLAIIMDSYPDKGEVVREAAAYAAKAVFKLAPPPSVRPYMLKALYEHGLSSSKKWQTRVGALSLLSGLANTAPDEIAHDLVDIIPHVVECMHDIKPEVQDAATKAMITVCTVVGNNDIIPLLPVLVSCMARPTEVAACVEKVSATTFVAEVTGPALAIMVPLLVRALNERSQKVLRQTCIIIDNLARLVKNPADAGQFLPQLLPGLQRAHDDASFPEVRQLATKAKNTLSAAGGSVQYVAKEVLPEDKPEHVLKVLRSLAEKKRAMDSPMYNKLTQFAAPMISLVIIDRIFRYQTWESLNICSPFIAPFLPGGMEDAKEVTKSLCAHYHDIDKARHGGQSQDDDDEEGEELCNIDFSLAYGGMMLLNHTTLKLRRGQRYGLCGRNGAGKTTLMRAIATGKVDNFPPQDVVRSVMVEHSLQGEDGSMGVLDFVASDPKLTGVSREKIQKALEEVGFEGDFLHKAVGSLSGGWKMKLELARAMLMEADLLLLDEPTNHLDVINVKWLEEYLIKQKRVTAVIVSHDSGFLDNVCTHIVHYENKKLVYYKGNLSQFVKHHPEAMTYYTLSNTNIQFRFPAPSILTGVRSNTKAILYMKNVDYQYPNTQRIAVKDASVQISLSSRVGIVGRNGAGKSTLIKLLLGELFPSRGICWKHPNLRAGYVAQHAFHHLEQHLDETPCQYLTWRYALGEDREVLEKVTRIWSEEEKEAMKTFVDVGGEKRQIESLVGRSKHKKSFQYEVKWVGKAHRHNTQIPRERLIELGFGKLIQQIDDFEASREGLGFRELNPAAIVKHFEDVGLPAETVMHTKISGLSGGQKVKVVLASAMWNNPHVLIMDEPSNYLDRDSLGGLAVAIRDWPGGVLLISHNEEFLTALCTEMWYVEDGIVTAKTKREANKENFGDNENDDQSNGGENGTGTATPEEGQVGHDEDEIKRIAEKAEKKAERGKKLTRNQLKEQAKRRRARELKWLVEGGPRPVNSDEE